MPGKNTEELIAEAQEVLRQKEVDENYVERRVKRLKKEIFIIMAFLVVFICFTFLYLHDYTSSQMPLTANHPDMLSQNLIIVPKYCQGDIIGYNVGDDVQCIILEYDKNLDEYKSRLVFKIEDKWLYYSENDAPTWDERENLELYYPIKIDHVNDISMIIPFDEYWEQEQARLLNDAINKIPPLADCHYKIDSKQTLKNKIKVLYSLSEQYQEDLCDCSEMSAYLEWWLESYGVHSYIVVGNTLPHPKMTIDKYEYARDEGGPHAWVEAEINGENVSIEPTGLYIIPDRLKPYYVEENRYENLEVLLKQQYDEGYDLQLIIPEYNWWEELPKDFIHISN